MIVGIDLGTTFSAVSVLNTVGIPTLIPDKKDHLSYHTPSVVSIANREAIIGEAVEKLLRVNPSLNVCRFAKKGMGHVDDIYTDDEAISYPAHAVSALILRKLKLDIEASQGEHITGAVIAVPAHFNDAQRRATIDAARLADLPVAGLVEEPVAAAVFSAASTDQSQDRTLLVFDLGGGTLDVTALQSSPDGLYVLATDGSDKVGGRHFDQVIMEMAESHFRAIHRQVAIPSRESEQRLRLFATEAKFAMSDMNSSSVTRPLMLGNQVAQITLHRAHFEQAAKPLLDICAETCQRVLQAKRLNVQSFDQIILTGGSSQLPAVERLLREIFAIPPHRFKRHQVRSAVAYGTVLMAEQMHGSGGSTIAPPLRQTVSTHELGIRALDEAGRPFFKCLIARNVALPASHEERFFVNTMRSNEVTAEVMQRKDSDHAPESLGVFRFGPLTSGRTDVPIKLQLGYETNGLINVRMVDLESRREFKDHYATSQTDLTTLNEKIDRLSVVS
jgi:molecular chaperone DnaK (HSP70)